MRGGTRPTQRAVVNPFHLPPTIYAQGVESVKFRRELCLPMEVSPGEPLPLLCLLAWVGEFMVALKFLRWRLVCLLVSVTLAITGCASRGGVDHDPYVSTGAQDYPV